MFYIYFALIIFDLLHKQQEKNSMHLHLPSPYNLNPSTFLQPYPFYITKSIVFAFSFGMCLSITFSGVTRSTHKTQCVHLPGLFSLWSGGKSPPHPQIHTQNKMCIHISKILGTPLTFTIPFIIDLSMSI